ncbi:MAG: 23S rRNA (guanosine(2251)-2'-O)-methyltransferase RlmB, partial [Oscillospiraceae bacterium]|nr:23S rRNA (guanosine(2251)-2'-O)-methyltransferase RlmB [Oscillospiraceae bacterium]
MEERQQKPNRDENVVAGRNAVAELLRSGREIDSLYIQKGELKGSVVSLVAKTRQQGIPVKEADSRKLDFMCGGVNHQGIVAVAAAWSYAELSDILEAAGESPFLVVCDHLEDPHNLGAVIRTAEAAGAHGVIIPKRGGVGLTTAVAKASAGAVEHLPVARVANIASTIKELQKKGIWVYCADMDGQPWCSTDF